MSDAVDIVIPNWFGRRHTLEALDSLARSRVAPDNVLVIDNGCRDFSEEEIPRRVASGTYLRLPANRGFAGACNTGMAYLFRRGARRVLLMNNDARVAPDALGAMIEAANRLGGPALLQALVLQNGHPVRVECAGIFVDEASGRICQIGHGAAPPPPRFPGELRSVPAASGTALMVPRELWEATGGFDERYFAYFEDVELSLRARSWGFGVMLVPGARVYHAGKASSGGDRGALSIYYATRNHLLLCQERLGGPPDVRRLRTLHVIALNLAYAISRPSRASALRAFLLGVRDFRRRHFGSAPDLLNPKPAVSAG